MGMTPCVQGLLYAEGKLTVGIIACWLLEFSLILFYSDQLFLVLNSSLLAIVTFIIIFPLMEPLVVFYNHRSIVLKGSILCS